MNQRGEVVTIVVVAVAAALLLGSLAPKLNPINWVTGNGTSTVPMDKTKYDRKKIISEPVLLTRGDHVAVGQRYEESYEKGEDSSERRATLGERIGGFFASLTAAGVIFVIISLLFFGGVPLLWLARKYFVVKHALTKTVMGIKKLKENDAVYYEQHVKPTLLQKHDKADSNVIDKIKSRL